MQQWASYIRKADFEVIICFYIIDKPVMVVTATDQPWKPTEILISFADKAIKSSLIIVLDYC